MIELQTENERLKHESQVMVQNYVRQLETKEDVIRRLKASFEENHQDRQVEVLSRRENRMLRDKIAELSRDLDMA